MRSRHGIHPSTGKDTRHRLILTSKSREAVAQNIYLEKAINQITVAVLGALGKVGREIITGVSQDPSLSLIGAIDIQANEDHLSLPNSKDTIPLADKLDDFLKMYHPQVIVDFSIAEAAVKAAKTAIAKGISLVIGTTGIQENDLAEIGRLAETHNVGLL